jgi:hypothetical protein
MKGISHGEWQQISKPQLKSKQRPCYPLKTRVWSTLILHTDGFQTERATKLERGKAVPITMADIASELNDAAEKYYREAGIEQADTHPVTSEQTRRCIVDFEQDGLCGRQEDGIYCWLIPRTPAPKRVEKQYAEATEESKANPSDLPQVFKVFHLSLTKKQLQDPKFIERATEAYGAAKKAFLDILESPAKSTPFAFLSPLQDGGNPPQQDGGIYKEENIVEKKGTPHPPPGVETTTGGRMRIPPKTERKTYPLTLDALRRADPAVSSSFITRLLTAIQNHPDFPQDGISNVTDEILLSLCEESYKTGPRHRSIGLLLSRVPAIAATWSQQREWKSA